MNHETILQPHEYLENQKNMSEKPDYYQKLKIDTWRRMEENASAEEIMGFIKGNIDKYNWRDKNQDDEDDEKIIAYAKWRIKIREKIRKGEIS